MGVVAHPEKFQSLCCGWVAHGSSLRFLASRSTTHADRHARRHPSPPPRPTCERTRLLAAHSSGSRATRQSATAPLAQLPPGIDTPTEGIVRRGRLRLADRVRVREQAILAAAIGLGGGSPRKPSADLLTKRLPNIGAAFPDCAGLRWVRPKQ